MLRMQTAQQEGGHGASIGRIGRRRVAELAPPEGRGRVLLPRWMRDYAYAPYAGQVRLSQIGSHQRQFPYLWYNEKGLNVPGGRQGARDGGNAQRGMRAGGRNQTAQAAGVSLKGKIPTQDNDGDGGRH